jgi:vanillate O-demethylase ferredoxin subunit
VPPNDWIAIGPSSEFADGHIAFVRVHDVELAVWRDEVGAINVWENRCPHRGVRLTIGTTTGASLTCRYHGWRFASGSGACTFIPAHPTQTPPKAAVIRTYARSAPDAPDAPAAPPRVADLPASPDVVLRSVTIDASADAVRDALATVSVDGAPAHFFLQPESAEVTTVHGAIIVPVAIEQRLALQHAYNDALTALRDRFEAATSEAATSSVAS